MKYIALITFLFAGCGIQSQVDKNTASDAHSALTQSTWCETQDTDTNGKVDTYRFYENGFGRSAEWNYINKALSETYAVEWTLVANDLVLTAANRQPNREIFRVSFAEVNDKKTMRWMSATRATPILLEQCTLPHDPR